MKKPDMALAALTAILAGGADGKVYPPLPSSLRKRPKSASDIIDSARKAGISDANLEHRRLQRLASIAGKWGRFVGGPTHNAQSAAERESRQPRARRAASCLDANGPPSNQRTTETLQRPYHGSPTR